MKQLKLKLILTVLMSMASINAFSYDALIDGIYYKFNGDEAIVTYRNPNSNNKTAYQGNVIIPSSVNYNSKDYSVTSIDAAFFKCSGLTSVTIPNSVTSIGTSSFNGCSGLTSVTIPNSVTSIGNYAFDGCSGLTSITIPNSVTSIGQHAFYNCSGLTSIEIPNSVTSIGYGAFYDCSGLTSIIVDSNNTKYDSRENCNAIIEKETDKLIAGCLNTHIPNSVTSIGDYAFYNCSGLTSIEIPNSVTSIGQRAFYNCSGLTSIEIPNSVTSIGGVAFSGCSGLTSVVIPNSVTSIGGGAFSGCSGLTSIIVDSNNTKYDSRENCNAIIEKETDKLIAGCMNTVIPNSVTSIGNSAFEGCSGLTSITIPNSVTSIGGHAFAGCSGLTSVTIGNSVTSIGDVAFNGCSGLTSITFPSSVTSIGQIAFRGCSGLTFVKVYSKTPIAISSGQTATFAVYSISIPLYVPRGSKAAYQHKAGWYEFINIVEFDEPFTLTASDLGMGYGDAVPEFTYSAEGGIFSGSPQFTCEVTSTSPVGTYPIVVSKGTIDNELGTYVNGTLTITKAPLTITAKSYTIKQGEALPTFEAEYAGFKNSETSSVLTTQPTITTSATSASEPGTYDIVVSGAVAGNYDITHVKGTLTITQADAVTVTAKSYSRQYGEANPAFEYTSSGATLTGTPSISCEATATSPVGEYPIVITKGSVTNYNDTYVNGTLTVTKAPLTITAKSYSIKQGEALPAFEAEYAGFKNSETASVLTTQPTITTSATSASAPGTYDIIVSGAVAGNYDITYVKGTLTITQADAVTVTAKSYSRQYGEANPTFEYTTAGATLSGTPSISCEATATSPVGEYPIVITKGSVTNYNDSYVNGTLTVTKAPLTITAKSYTIKQGEALPTFEAEYAGFKNSETSSVLTTQPTITTSATSASEPGTYDIIISGASATNYDITHVKGTLTITQADAVTVTAKSYSRQYGEANPAFEYTSSGAALSGTPSISCSATASSPVGEYDIVASKGTVTNYNVTYVNGRLTITKAPLTITAKSYSIKQGEALPAFEAEYAGFKNSETSSVLTTQPTITTSATSVSEPGTYDIVVSGASATNYDITYVKGTLTITPNSTGILEISAGNPVDVYNIQGNKVRSKATTLSDLPKGIYIVNGRKVIVK